MAEELRIGIVTDIATVTAMTKAAALNLQSNLTAGANLPGGHDALFGVLLQQLAQPAAPANDSAQPVAANDTVNAQTDPQTEPQASRQTPQGLSNLTVLLQNPVPQQTAATGAPASTVPNQPANDAAAFVVQPQIQTAPSPSQTDGAAHAADPSTAAVPDAAVKSDPKSAADVIAQPTRPQSDGVPAADSVIAAPAPDVQPAPQIVREKNVKPAAKDDQKKTADNAPSADPNIAPDANLVAALTQQIQAVAIQPQSSAGNAVAATETVAAGAPPVGPVSDAKPTPLHVQSQSVAAGAMNSANAASTDATQAATSNSGALDNSASNIEAPEADASKADAAKADAKAIDTPPSLAAAPHNAAPASNRESSVAGQSANTTPSATAMGVQAQVQTASAASVQVNLQVAPQRHGSDAASTPAWDTLGVTIAAKSADGVKHFDIRLDPPELGRVEVHLSLDDSGKAQASLVVDKPQTLELLQRDAANLTRSLNDAGVSLSNNGLNFSLRGQERQSDGGVVRGRGRALSVKALVGTDAISNSSSIYSLAPDSARLDIRV